MNRFVKFYFTHLLFLIIFIFILCSLYVHSFPLLQSQDFESSIISDPVDFSKMTWKTFHGEVRNYEKTHDILKKIMEEYKIPGISIALSQKGSGRKQAKTLFFYLGVEDPNTCEPIDGETVFRAGRLGQPVFSYMIMKLFIGRRFDIDIPLHKYLPKPIPDYPAYQDLKGDSRYKRLTASRILSHQSGLVNSRLTHPEPQQPGKNSCF